VTAAQVLLFFILVIGSYTSIVNHRFHLRALLPPAAPRSRQAAKQSGLLCFVFARHVDDC